MRAPRLAVAALTAAAALAAPPAPASAQQTHLLVIVGLGGDPAYTERFHAWAATLVEAATDRYGLPPAHVTWLGERTDLDPAVADRSTKENIAAALAAIAERAAPEDDVAIVVFGHGSFTDAARINLPGRDLSAAEAAALLDGLRAARITFVNTASASGPFIEALAGDGRVVMTATRTGRERNAPLFGGFFAEAFADGAAEADQDRNERVSMLEAFTYARLKVAAAYEAEGIIQTEHALLDDDGDGAGAAEPDPLAGDGRLARTAFLLGGADAVTARRAFPDDPALQPLYAQQADLEARVDELRALRGGADPAQYEAELERLLVELALASREIRRLEAAREDAVREAATAAPDAR